MARARRIFAVLDPHGSGRVSGQDLRYALRSMAPRRSGKRGPGESYLSSAVATALLETFPAAPVMGLAAKVLGTTDQCA